MKTLVAAEGVGVGDVVDARIGELPGSGEGGKALERAGSKHAQVLLPQGVVDGISAALDDIKRQLLGGVTKAG